MAQGAILTHMVGDFEQHGSLFDCKMELSNGMTMADFASKVGSTLQLHADFDPMKEPTSIAKSIITALTKEQATLLPGWQKSLMLNPKKTSNEVKTPAKATNTKATNAKGKRAADDDAEPTPAPAPKKPRKTKAESGAAPKRAPKKKAQPKPKDATQETSSNNSTSINTNNSTYINTDNKAHASVTPSVQRKKNSAQAAPRLPMPQPNLDNFLGSVVPLDFLGNEVPTAPVDNDMGQMALLTPPESGQSQGQGFLPTTQVADMGHQPTMAVNTGRIFHPETSLAFPVPQLNSTESTPVTEAVAQAAFAFATTQMVSLNGSPSNSRETFKSPWESSAGPIRGAAPDTNMANGYFSNEPNSTTGQNAQQQIKPEDHNIAQASVSQNNDDLASLFGEDSDETDHTQQMQDPNQHRINELTRLDIGLPLSIIRAFINPTNDCPYSAIKAVVLAGDYSDQSGLLFDEHCRAIAKKEYDAISRNNFQINETDRAEWDPAVRNAEKRARKKKQRAQEQNRVQQQQADPEPHYQPEQHLAQLLSAPGLQEMQHDQSIQSNQFEVNHERPAEDFALDTQFDLDMERAFEEFEQSEQVLEETCNNQPQPGFGQMNIGQFYELDMESDVSEEE
ncbi:hypothetical protein G7Z17_g9250 [Cylindrodendrum hubeiense]|uniref:Uncharacterized protein n=1 Tax=Cylindrodendrum hubeiense TaxID=595255 RepID=A0A9P5H896_9HYPO|nr:hypothetical protein G7Z17_g9250 [Cylindrodendrum hubeiense]